MSDPNYSEADKLLSSDFDEPKKVETPKPEAEVPKTEVAVEEKQPEVSNLEAEVPKTEVAVEEKQPKGDMVVEEVKTPKRRGRTPKKALPVAEEKQVAEGSDMVVDEVKTPPKRGRTPKKASPKKAATPTKSSPKKVEKEIVTDPLKVSTRKSTKHSNWSELIYGSSEQYAEGDTLAVRAPKDSGDQFWLCTLDGFGTEENNKDDLEITWYEAKGTGGIYIEGEEDDIAAESVICRTRLNPGKDGSWVLPQIEFKAIRDTLKLEQDESSEIILDGDDRSDEASYKDGEEDLDAKGKRGPKPKEEKLRREAKSGEKRKAAPETNGEPKPKRTYKKREKKGADVAATEGTTTEPTKIEAETPTTTTTTTTTPSSTTTTTTTTPTQTTSTFPSTFPTPLPNTTAITQPPMSYLPQNLPQNMQHLQHLPQNMQHLQHLQHLQGMPMQLNMPSFPYMPTMQMGGMHMQPMHMQPMQNHVQNQLPNQMQSHVQNQMQGHVQNQSQSHVPNSATPTPTVTEIVSQPVAGESKTEAV